MRSSFISSALRRLAGGSARSAAAWLSVEPDAGYDVVIVGGGVAALATAVHLARDHGIRKVAVLAPGSFVAEGRGEPAAIVRSTYRQDSSMALFEAARAGYESLGREFGSPGPFSRGGVLHIASSEPEVAHLSRIADLNRHAGIDSWMVPPQELVALAPAVDMRPGKRFPVLGALWHPRGGIVDHERMADALAGAAARQGVALVEQCEVIGLTEERGRIAGVLTIRGPIVTERVLLAASRTSGELAQAIGLPLPLASHPLQMLVTEPVQPLLGAALIRATPRLEVLQTATGEIVATSGVDAHPGQSGRLRRGILAETAAALADLLPQAAGLALMRTATGSVETTPDGAPLIGPAGPEGLLLGCGWGTAELAAAPAAGALLAAMLVTGETPPLAAPFAPSRFGEGRRIDEVVEARAQ